MASVRLSSECEERLDRLAKQTGRSKSYYIKKAVEESLPRLEYVYGMLDDVEKFRSGKLETQSLEEVRKEFGL